MSTISEKISNPAKFYHHPKEVRQDDSLTNEEKITLLINWRDDEKLKSVAADESMTSPNPTDNNCLASIEKLLHHYQGE